MAPAIRRTVRSGYESVPTCKLPATRRQYHLLSTASHHTTENRSDSRLTQMYRHIGCVRDQRPVGVHQRATEVQPFLDVCRDGRLLQDSTHRFGYGHEAVGAAVFVVVMSARMRARVVVGRERYQSAGRQEVSLIFDCDCSLGR
jgi:hypothetical protein